MMALWNSSVNGLTLDDILTPSLPEEEAKEKRKNKTAKLLSQLTLRKNTF